MPHILLTGAGGFVGGHVAEVLHQTGYNLTAIYRTKPTPQHPWRALAADLTSDEGRKALNEVAADMVIHCAATLPASFANDGSRQCAVINETIDNNILNYCIEKNCSLIYTSSTSVYDGVSSPWGEQLSLQPRDPYAKEKLLTESKIMNSGIRAMIFRITSPYGPTQRLNTVLKLFIERSLMNQDLVYYGTGGREQDFIAVEDVATAIQNVLKVPNATGVFNIASGQPISMKALAELVARTVPKTTSKVVASGQPDPQEHYRARIDVSKAKKNLGWQTSVSLEEGIRRWANYLKEHTVENRNII